MKNNSTLIYGLLLIMGDFFAIVSSFVIAYIIRVQYQDELALLNSSATGTTFLKTLLAMTPFYILIFALLGLYNKEVYERRFREFGRVLIGTVVGMMAIISVNFAATKSLFPARLVPVYAFVISLILVVLVRNFLRAWRQLLFSYGVGINNVLIIGSTPATTELTNYLGDTRKSGYRIAGYFGKKGLVDKAYGSTHFSSLSTALTALKNIHTIIQTQLFDEETNRKILEAAQQNHIAYKFIPANASLYTSNNEVELFHNFPVIAVHQTALIGWGRLTKRLFDLVGAILGLGISLPIFVIVGVIIKITDPDGPIFYKHKRISRFGTVFYAYKLRSMYWKYSTGAKTKKTDLEIFKELGRDDLVAEWKQNQKIKIDPRVMPIGRFIRKTSLDELPQLLNVIKGELSLIGPRPVTKDELKRYEKASSIFLSVKPGITGLWQVSGRNNTTYEERIALDLYYVQQWSFWLDIKIMYRTLIVMLTGKGQ